MTRRSKGPSRIPDSIIGKMREMRRQGDSIGKIGETFGLDKNTTWQHVHDIQPKASEPMIIDVPPEPKKEVRSTPLVPHANVTSMIQLDPFLVSVLMGLCYQEGYGSDLNRYLKERVIDWMSWAKDYAPRHTAKSYSDWVGKTIKENAELWKEKAERIRRLQSTGRDRSADHGTEWEAARIDLARALRAMGYSEEQIKDHLDIFQELEKQARAVEKIDEIFS